MPFVRSGSAVRVDGGRRGQPDPERRVRVGGDPLERYVARGRQPRGSASVASTAAAKAAGSIGMPPRPPRRRCATGPRRRGRGAGGGQRTGRRDQRSRIDGRGGRRGRGRHRRRGGWLGGRGRRRTGRNGRIGPEPHWSSQSTTATATTAATATAIRRRLGLVDRETFAGDHGRKVVRLGDPARRRYPLLSVLLGPAGPAAEDLN